MRVKDQNAFTLVELLLVVTIIGILAGSVLVSVTGTTNDAKITRANQDIEVLATALSAYEIKMGRFPTSEQGLNALVQDPGVEGWKPFLTKRIYRDPWGNDYQYRNPGDQGINFDLYSVGPDGQTGTEDDISNWEQSA